MPGLDLLCRTSSVNTVFRPPQTTPVTLDGGDAAEAAVSTSCIGFLLHGQSTFLPLVRPASPCACGPSGSCSGVLTLARCRPSLRWLPDTGHRTRGPAAPGHVDTRPNLCPDVGGAQESAACECLGLRAPCLCLCLQPEPVGQCLALRAKCRCQCLPPELVGQCLGWPASRLCLCLEPAPQAGTGPASGRVFR